MANECDTPSPFSERFPLGEHAIWRCDTPPPRQKGYLSDTSAIPYEEKANGCDTPLRDTISKGYCAIWGGISHWAAKLFILWEIGHFEGRGKLFQRNISPIFPLMEDFAPKHDKGELGGMFAERSWHERGGPGQQIVSGGREENRPKLGNATTIKF